MLDKWISRAILGGVVSSLVSIFLSEVCFGLALLLWIADCWRRGELHLKRPPFFTFVLAFFLATLLAIAFSSDVLTSAGYLRKFIKFFYIFLIFTYVTRDQVEPALKAFFAVLAAAAGYGILQYFWLMDVNLVNRIEGFMSHWMTFSGQLMLGSVALAAYIFFYRLPDAPGEGLREKVRVVLPWSLLLAVLLLALILTYTRNAWLGTLGGLFVVVGLYRVRWILGGCVLLALLFFLLPGGFKQRLYSSFDPNDTTTRIRLELLLTGRNIIAAHPFTGLGPGMVPRLYGDYNGTDEFPSWIYQHLHNNLLHIAAEMGMAALGLWLLLWMRLLWDFIRFVRYRSSDLLLSCVAVQGVAVVVAFLLAGLLEYNFGDSEILILLLFFITVPYVVRHGQEAPA